MSMAIPGADPERVLFTAQMVEEVEPAGRPMRAGGARLGNRITCGVPVCYDKEMDLIVRKRRGSTVAATLAVAGRGLAWGVFPAPLARDDQRFHC